MRTRCQTPEGAGLDGVSGRPGPRWQHPALGDDRGNERMRELRERPAEVVLLQRNLASHRRGEPAQAQGFVEKNRGHIGSAQEIFEIVVRTRSARQSSADTQC